MAVIRENYVDKMSYSQACQCIKNSEQLNLQKCKVGVAQVVEQSEFPDKGNALEGTVDKEHTVVSERQYTPVSGN